MPAGCSRTTSASSPEPGRLTVLDRSILAEPTEEAAPDLLGVHLVREQAGLPVRIGRIVEVEAYIGETDLASHARFGQTARNRVMFGPPGIAYVYLVYGMYACLNVVTEAAGRPAAVLIRAVAPLDGVEAMRAARVGHELRRRKSTRSLESGSEEAQETARRIDRLPVERLASGPGLVAAAFGIDPSMTGTDLCDRRSALRLEVDEAAPAVDRRVIATPRIGIDYAGEPWVAKPWRFVLAGERAVSGPRLVDRGSN